MSNDPTRLVEAAATRVRDPVSGKSVYLAGIVRDAKFDGQKLSLTLAFGAHTTSDRDGIEQALSANLRAQGYDGPLDVKRVAIAPGASERPKDKVPGMSAGGGVQPHGGPVQKKPVDGVTHVIAVASGKGGVGKSTVATNVAVALAKQGKKVGLLDADVYGPSLPKMMNVSGRPMVDAEQRILPAISYGVKCLSTGLLVDDHEAVIWRGPMVMSLIRQLLQQAAWGPLDVLVVDLPPGTGDAQLTLIQAVDLAGAVIVTTPQDVALADAIRGITMFQKLEVPLLGLVENMAWYELPDGRRDPVFGEGGGARVAAKYQTDLLAQIPLRTALRASGDQGLPAALGDDATARAFADIAAKVWAKLAARG
jgi:ATP-binding protein involved in chromosome partitioning